MAGDLKTKYGTAVTLSTTGMGNLQTSATLLLGWSTGQIDNTSTLATDYLISGQICLGTISSTTIGIVALYAYSPLDPTTATLTWPSFGTAGWGTSGTLTVSLAVIRDSGMKLLWSTAEDGKIGTVFNIPATSIADAFGSVPDYFALWVTHSSVTSLSASNNFLYSLPVLAQYT